jgi:hypothetical protein
MMPLKVTADSLEQAVSLAKNHITYQIAKGIWEQYATLGNLIPTDKAATMRPFLHSGCDC